MANERHYNGVTRGTSSTRGTYRGRGTGRTHRNDNYYGQNSNNNRRNEPQRARQGRGRGRRGNGREGQPCHEPPEDNPRQPEKRNDGRDPSSRQHESDEISQLRHTIASLQTKLDEISKPQRTTSNNPDFADVAKTFYKWAQLKHHQSNSQQIPKSIYSRIDQLVLNIRPPNGYDDLRGRQLSLATKFAKDIRDVVCVPTLKISS
jgi:hypothetical protein